MASFFARLLGLDGDSAAAVEGFPDHQVAAGALLVVAGMTDGNLDPAERDRVERLLVQHFGLTANAAARLFHEAERQAVEAVEWHGFTRTLKEHFDEAGRIELIEMLWEVILTDGAVHDYEASLMRRVAGLLYVADGESALARRRALARLGR